MGTSSNAALRPVSSPSALQWTSVYMDAPHPAASPPPSELYHPHLLWHVTKWLHMFHGMGEHEAGLTGHKTHPGGVKIPLVLLNLDGKCGDVVVNLAVACDLPCQAPIVGFGHCGLKDVDVATWPGEHVLEPCG
jgi:hypothetical protein